MGPHVLTLSRNASNPSPLELHALLKNVLEACAPTHDPVSHHLEDSLRRCFFPALVASLANGDHTFSDLHHPDIGPMS